VRAPDEGRHAHCADHPAWVELSAEGSSEEGSAAPDEDWLRRTAVPLSRVVLSPTQVARAFGLRQGDVMSHQSCL